MSFEALKQYFRSRHSKTSYTEEEPSTLFFSKDGESRNDTLTNLFFSVRLHGHCLTFQRTVNQTQSAYAVVRICSPPLREGNAHKVPLRENHSTFVLYIVT